eukprot:Gb_17334 [translate_table: standard]
MEATWSYWEFLEWLILAVALQLAAVAYGVNSFSKPLEDLEGCMVKLLECLRNPGYRLGIVIGCSWFVKDGAPLLQRVGKSEGDIAKMGLVPGSKMVEFIYENLCMPSVMER